MAGDEFYIYLCDHTKKILEERYLGKLRYHISKFSLQYYQYEGNNSFYEIEERMSDGQSRYSIWTKEITDKIRKSLLDEPLSNDEKEILIFFIKDGFKIPNGFNVSLFNVVDKTLTKKNSLLERTFYKFIYNNKARFSII